MEAGLGPGPLGEDKLNGEEMSLGRLHNLLLDKLIEEGPKALASGTPLKKLADELVNLNPGKEKTAQAMVEQALIT